MAYKSKFNYFPENQLNKLSAGGLSGWG